MMNEKMTKMTGTRRGAKLKAVVALALLAVSLAGCVVYPNNGYYGGYYAPAPVYYGPPVAFDFGFGGGYYGRGGWR